MYAIRIDTPEVKQRQLQRRGFSSKAAATDALEHIRDLLKVAGDDEEYRALIGERIFEDSARGGALPGIEDVRRLKDANVDPSQRPVTVSEWLGQWLEMKAHDEAISPGTLALRRHHVEMWWRLHLGSVRLDRLTDTHIHRVRTWVKDRNVVIKQARAAREPVPVDPLDPRMSTRVLSDNTWAQILATLDVALAEAQRRGYLVRNPMKLVRGPTVDRKPPKVWTAEEAKTFIAFAYERDPWQAPLFELALRRGLRRGELLGLRWGDVDWKSGYLTIGQQRVGNDGHVRERMKTAASAREIPLGPALLGRLRELYLRRGRPGGNALLFVDRLGNPPKPPNLTRQFQALARKAGLPVITLHQTRHTALTLLLESGVDVKTVADIAGHSDVRTTLNTYRVVTRAAMEQAVEKIDARLDPEGVPESGQLGTAVW
jgi:integrase